MENIKNISTKYLVLLIFPLLLVWIPLILKENIISPVSKILIDKLENQFKVKKDYVELSILPPKEEPELTIYTIANSLEIKPYTKEIFTEKKVTEPPPNYKISFIYIGINKRFAIINGKLYRENDRISKDERIIRIERNKILLFGKWGERWIEFIK
ncbi:hypothetical protein [Persephonella sp.]